MQIRGLGVAENTDFESLLKEINHIVDLLEKGGLTLEESISLYSKGMELLKNARAILNNAEARLEVLISQEDGSIKREILEPEKLLNED